MKEINIQIHNFELDFNTIQKITIPIAQKTNPDTMLMSWKDTKMNRISPSVTECNPNGIPGWEAYGLNRGGRLKINVNDGEYIFIYT